ncbi:MAG TPA: DUF3499 family protein [Acidimicrobiales bacterium]|nr:DUF3499 family protein [Acidimicrobiales bacterium]
MCGTSAAATLYYDYEARTAWLDSMSPDPVPGTWAVCASHADTLRVPSGWRLIDQRAPAPAGTVAAMSALALSVPSAPIGRSEQGYRPPLAV